MRGGRSEPAYPEIPRPAFRSPVRGTDWSASGPKDPDRAFSATCFSCRAIGDPDSAWVHLRLVECPRGSECEYECRRSGSVTCAPALRFARAFENRSDRIDRYL